MHFRGIDRTADSADHSIKFDTKNGHVLMMPRLRTRERAGRKALKPVTASPCRSQYSRGAANATQQKEICDYVAATAAELAELSVASGLDSLAVACDVVREIAQGNVNSQSRQVEFLPVSRRN